MPKHQNDELFDFLHDQDQGMSSSSSSDPFRDPPLDASSSLARSHAAPSPLHSHRTVDFTNLTPLQAELSTVTVAAQNLYEATTFVSTLGGDLIKHDHYVRLATPVADMMGALGVADRAMRRAIELGMRDEDVVTDRELFCRWTADATVCLLGFQSGLENEVERIREWLGRGAEEVDGEDEEWMVVERDGDGEVRSGPVGEEKEWEVWSHGRGEDKGRDGARGEEFEPDLDWELWSYGQQLNVFLEDLGVCIPAAARKPSKMWQRGRQAK
jgi:hypothetical protein